MAINPWFDRFILTVIIVNCFFLAVDKEMESINKYSDDIDMVFLLIYTVEMVLKIIAMGFFMRAHSYLRDTWNVLDFVVVILGWVSLYLAEQNISAIRVIRILRPLRTINSMPGMSGLVSTILNSLPIMFDIMVLFCFMLIMFGTIATQLLGGKLLSRCFVPLDKEWEVNPGAQYVTSFNETMYAFPDNQEMFCQNDCGDRVDAESARLYGNNLVCLEYRNPVYGTFNFDNILYSIMNIFQIITLEGWTEQMYTVRNVERSNFFDIFFISCVLFGAFFVLNLMIAVQFTYLGEAFDEEERRQKEIQEKLN